MPVRLARFLVTFILAFFNCALAIAQSSEAEKLVRKIAYMPEFYQQMCSHPPSFGSSVVIHFGGAATFSEFALSAQQFARLRARRNEVIKVLHVWLENAAAEGLEETQQEPSIEEFKEERVERGEKYIARSSYGTRSKLLMLVDLNDVSALPLLKAYADKWHKLSKQKPDSWAVPQLSDILSTIVAILRQERFEPVLSSQFEKDAEAKMADEAKALDETLRRRRDTNLEELTEQDRAWVLRDPVTGLPVILRWYPKLTISDETVVEILSWVDQYQKLPAKKRLDAKGMMPWPINR